MTRRHTELALFDPEIEKTLTRLRKEKSQVQLDNLPPPMANQEEVHDGTQDGAQVYQPDVQRSLRDYAAPLLGEIHSSIRRPAIQANNFVIKPATIQMIQTAVQFSGLPSEDPNGHILNFLEICDTFKFNGVSDDAIRLRLFPFSLRDKAKVWLNSMPPGSITTWDGLASKFLAKFFPPAKTARMRNDILSFVQYDSESLYESWERYKDLLRKCPHHNIPQWLQVQTFYNGLHNTLRSNIDAAAGGALMNKGIDDAYQLIEDMAANNYQWNTERAAPRRVAGLHEVDTIAALTAQMAAMSKQIGEVKSMVAQPNCNSSGAAHYMEGCPSHPDEVQYVGSYQSPQQNNPYSNTYNPGWRNHPNFSWSNNQNAQQLDQSSANPPGFSQSRQPPQEKKPALEDLMAQLIQVQTTTAQTQMATMKNMEMQIGQLANAMAQFQRQPGSLPSNTEPNPKQGNKEHCNAITLRSGTTLEGPQQYTSELEVTQPSPPEPVLIAPVEPPEPMPNAPAEPPTSSSHPPVESPSPSTSQSPQENNPPSTQKKIYPPPPFPQRLQQHKQQTDQQFSKFLEVIKKLHINIPFAEALMQMPTYAKFMKELITHKRRLEDVGKIALTEECSAVILKKLPPKLKDPGSFTIPCAIGTKFEGKALCDLGASINLMPLSIFKQLGLGEAKPTTITLQLADRSLKHPRGVIEDVLVKVDKLILPADFVVLDMKEDGEIPIILGRPFLATGGAIIDVQNGILKMKVGDQKVTFNVFKAIALPTFDKACFRVDVVEQVEEEIQKQVEEEIQKQVEEEIQKQPTSPLLAILVDGYTSDKEKVNACSSARSYKKKRWRAQKITNAHVEPGHQVILDSSRLNLFPGRLKSE